MATKKKAQNEQLKVSNLADFKSRVRGVFELPSGMVVKMKNPGGLQAFIANGTIPNSLLNIVQDTLADAKGDQGHRIEAAKKLMDDGDKMAELMKLMDLIAANCIIEPKCAMAPTEDDVKKHNILHPDSPVSDPDELRDDENFLYTDEIDMMDKQFIMQWVNGGVRDLETFRAQHEANVDLVSAGEGSANSTKSTSGSEG